MRFAAAVLVMLVTGFGVHAQTSTPVPYVYRQGYYEFESETSNMTTTGTWATENLYGVVYRTGTNTSTISFWVRGKYLMIARNLGGWATTDKLRVAYSSTYVDCMLNFPVSANEFCVVVMPDNSNNYQITITVTSTGFSYARLDAFMLMDESAPTATAITIPTQYPTPTAIVIPTQYPTPTEITFPPTPTAISLTLVAAPDVAVYATLESGQMTKFEYAATAADVQISNLLVFIFLSVWGMFLIYIFVVWRVDKR